MALCPFESAVVETWALGRNRFQVFSYRFSSLKLTQLRQEAIPRHSQRVSEHRAPPDSNVHAPQDRDARGVGCVTLMAILAPVAVFSWPHVRATLVRWEVSLAPAPFCTDVRFAVGKSDLSAVARTLAGRNPGHRLPARGARLWLQCPWVTLMSVAA